MIYEKKKCKAGEENCGGKNRYAFQTCQGEFFK